MVWLDDRDLRAALDADRARLKQVELERALETQRGESAQREWAILGANRPDTQAELALRRQHLALAEANVASAQAAVERAERNVARTVIAAPFDALVISENVEIGQVAQPGTQLASLVGTEALWVSVSVPVDKLTTVDIPGFNAETGAGSQVVLRQRLGEGEVSRVGQVIGLAGQLDPQTRTAALLVAVERPFDPPAGELPLLPGAHVEADVAGRALEDVFEVPRVAVFDGASVWVVDGEERLLRRDLQLGWRGADTVYVTGGLSAGERVVVTPMGLPVPGMPVQATLRAKTPGQEG